MDIPIKKEFKDHDTELKHKRAFLFSKNDLESFHKGKENHKRILHKDFYEWSLSKLPKLQKYIDKSYDEENRKVYKDDKQIFKIYFLYRIVDIILKKITPSIDEVIF